MSAPPLSDPPAAPAPPAPGSDGSSLPWLAELMRRLLGPGGCPWDQEQTLQSLRPYLLEEAYEVLEALDGGSRQQHCDELGDLLLQIVFQAALAGIALDEIVRSIGDKLIRRHPHVFGQTTVRDASEVVVNWERIKASEQGHQERSSVLDGIPVALPGLHRSHELTRKAARRGLTWPDSQAARRYVDQTLARADEASTHAGDGMTPTGATAGRAVGELLLAVADWARLQGIEPEQALRDANARFAQRVRTLEGAPPATTPDPLAEPDPRPLGESTSPGALLARLWPLDPD